MDHVRPKFMDTDFCYYDDDGIKIKEDSPEWVKEEYQEFMDGLNSGVVEE